jgi:hypothetical protein
MRNPVDGRVRQNPLLAKSAFARGTNQVRCGRFVVSSVRIVQASDFADHAAGGLRLLTKTRTGRFCADVTIRAQRPTIVDEQEPPVLPDSVFSGFRQNLWVVYSGIGLQSQQPPAEPEA